MEMDEERQVEPHLFSIFKAQIKSLDSSKALAAAGTGKLFLLQRLILTRRWEYHFRLLVVLLSRDYRVLILREIG